MGSEDLRWEGLRWEDLLPGDLIEARAKDESGVLDGDQIRILDMDPWAEGIGRFEFSRAPSPPGSERKWKLDDEPVVEVGDGYTRNLISVLGWRLISRKAECRQQMPEAE